MESIESEIAYCAARAASELAMAGRASGTAPQAHFLMAEGYQQRIDAMEASGLAHYGVTARHTLRP